MRRASGIATLVLFCAAGWVGCEPGLEQDAEEADRRRLDRMRAEIVQSIEDLTCSDATDCAAIAFGAKPCGGPWEYLLYSRIGVDEAELQRAVEAYNQLNHELNARWGWVSDCALAPQPRPDCVEQTCVDVSEP